ncbi:hypothetical protein lerEdw1_002915 [Lerista edwardsae]|nr:hypothetical protein lerEdw1_002915 [Lerista edwardsae]
MKLNSLRKKQDIHMRAASGLPNCTIFVVEAGYLGFTVQPGNRWILEVKRTYTITVEVYDKSSTKIYPSDNLRITHRFPVEYFEEITSSANGSYHVVQILQDGVTVIKATLVSVVLQSGLEDALLVPISHEQEVKIYLPIQLTPSFLAFPHHPLDVLYQYRLQVTLTKDQSNSPSLFKSPSTSHSVTAGKRQLEGAHNETVRSHVMVEGGSGNFTWTSSNQTVATVTVKGVVTAGLVQGQSAVQARDVQNPFHFGEIQASLWTGLVSLGESLGACGFWLLESLGVPPRGSLRGKGAAEPAISYKELPATSLNLNVQVYVLRLSKMEFVPSHADIEIGQPLEIPLAMYHIAKEKQETIRFTDCSLLPLDISMDKQGVFALDEEAKQKASPLFCSSIHLTAKSLGHTLVTASATVFEEFFETSATFAAYEPLRLRVERKDKVGVVEVRLPAKRKQNLYIYRITCLELGEQVFTFQVGNQPGVLNPNPAVEMVQVPVSSLRNTVLELALFDQHRRKFDNFSSLVLEWISANATLAHFSHPRAMQMVPKDDGTGQTRLHGHQLLEVHQLKGTVLIAVNFVKYSERGSPKEVSNSPASAAVELMLVEDVTVVPDNVTMYNHPDVKEVFELVEGSGYFLVNSSTEGMVNITYLEAESAVQVVPVLPGSLTLEVYDLCLAFLGPATAYLSVSNMYELEVDLIDKIEIGKSMLVSVRVLGHHRQTFRSKYFPYMRLQLKAASPIVTLALMEEVGDYSEVYVLRAMAVGQTTLVATAWDKMGVKFTSAPRKVEVMSEGGPQPQSLIHFFISNQTVATVNVLGQVTARAVGSTTILGTIRAVNEDTGKVIVFSQDQVALEVVQLKAIRIYAPATRLITGTEMPVYVVGLTSALTPFSFGNANPGLTFRWTMSKRDVLELLPRHSEAFLELVPESNFGMVVCTKAAGRTSIKVTVSTLDPEAGQFEGEDTELSDEVQVLVFDKLQLFSPEWPAEQILMSMNSQLRLLTNREGAAFVSSQLLQCFPNSSVIEEDGHGLLKAGAVTGTAVLQVTALELFGVNQTILTGVRVAPVSYLWLSIAPKLYTANRTPLHAFPLGMSLTFTAHFYDSTGEKFHAQSTQLYLALNRDDLLLIRPSNKNHTYVAQAVNRGVTLLAVWDEKHPGMADYVPVPVEQAIQPNLSEPLALGDVVCFSTALVNQEGEPGSWHIAPSDILEMETASGTAFAKHAGKVTVFNDIPGIVKTYQEVVVSGSSRLTLQLGPKNFLTNAPNSSEFLAFVTSSSKGDTLRGKGQAVVQLHAITNLLSPESHLTCQVEFSETVPHNPASRVFHVQSVFYTDKGRYACVITAKPQPEEDLLALSTAEGSVTVTASFLHELSPAGAQRLVVPFWPAFCINQTEVAFSSKQLIGEVAVLGARRVIERLKVQPSSPAIKVGQPRRLADMPRLVVYPVSVVNLTFLQQMAAPAFINLSCTLTDQRAAVLVRVLSEHHLFGQCAEPGLVQQLLGSYQVLLFTICAVLASFMVLFLEYPSHQPSPQYRPPSPQYQPPGTAGRNRTQAWLWSVRR